MQIPPPSPSPAWYLTLDTIQHRLQLQGYVIITMHLTISRFILLYQKNRQPLLFVCLCVYCLRHHTNFDLIADFVPCSSTTTSSITSIVSSLLLHLAFKLFFVSHCTTHSGTYLSFLVVTALIKFNKLFRALPLLVRDKLILILIVDR